MKIYFLSAMPCALSVNGCYFGLCDTFERFADLSLKEENYILFQPQGAGAIGFFLTEQIRFSPPKGCAVYLLPDAIAIYAKDFPPVDFTLRPLQQLRDEKTLATLYMQGVLQLSIESEFGFFVSTLPPCFSEATLEFTEELLIVKTQNHLAIFSKKGEKLLQECVLFYERKDTQIHLQIPLSDCLGRMADCKYEIQNGQLIRTQCILSQARTFASAQEPSKLRDELLPFAFFESILLGADYTQFLHESLQEKATALHAFLGDYSAVTMTNNANVCGLVREKQPDLYTVDYYTVERKDGKIIDVKG